MIGRTLAHYRVLEQIGSGGMGDVYLAEDTTLDRQVALKVLPPDVAGDAERRARFTREAKVVAALNHPNIVTVHSVEEADGVHFFTMELVKGRTLAELLPKHGFALNRFFEIAIPLATALAAAHQAGITHRDLKPGNVMIDADGRVKVLDFGLAKAHGRDSTSADMTQLTTQEGHVVGTPAYMSPEQAEGRQVDARSDLFSLGIVFYELLTGIRPFRGDTPSSIVSSILKDTPRPVNELQPAVPRTLARLVQRCLAKDPRARYQTALDLQHHLEETKDDIDSGDAIAVGAPSRAGRHKRGMLTLAVIGVILLASAGGLWLFGLRADPTLTSVPRLGNAVQVTSSLDVESYPTWSPDGLRIAYQAAENGWQFVGDFDIFVAQLGGGEPVNLTPGSPANDRMPSWSPDGRQIAFFSDRDRGWGLYTVAAIGGNPQLVLPLPGVARITWSAPQWSSDTTRVLVTVREGAENVAIVVSLASSESTRIVLPRHEGNFIHSLAWSPDEHRFAYVEGGEGTTDVSRLWTSAATGGEPVPLTDGLTDVSSASWSRDGHTVFYVSNRGGSRDLWQQAISDGGAPVGEPLPITRGLDIRSAMFSADGSRLAYAMGGRVSNLWRVPILPDRVASWADAAQLTFDRADIETVDVSPDGELLAFSSDRRGNKDLWVMPSAGGPMTQLTTDPTPDWYPRWSPDGSEIAFYAYRTGNRDIWVMPSRGGPARQLTSDPGQDWFPAWSPDGSQIAYQSIVGGAVFVVSAQGGERHRVAMDVSAVAGWSREGTALIIRKEGRLYRVPTDGREPQPLPSLPDQVGGSTSRDGRFLYYSARTDLGNIDLWKHSFETGEASRLTTLSPRRGLIGGFTCGDNYLYFLWREGDGDIWVMDVVSDER